MIKFSNGILVRKLNELPDPRFIEELFLDFETTSGDIKEKSVNPWKHCDILGYSFTFDSHPQAYYVPLRHEIDTYNLPIEPSLEYLRRLVGRATKRLIGHNLKYDLHVGINYANINPWHLDFVDTRTTAKILNSDRFEYSLTGLSKDWLYEDIKEYEKNIHKYTHTPGGKWKYHDYAVIPADKMAPYACQDVQTLRKLYTYIREKLPSDCQEIYDTEVALTKRLLQIERYGVRLDAKKVIEDGLVRVPDLLRKIEVHLERLTGKIFRPNVNKDCYEILAVEYGLPVVEWTKGSSKKEPEPSYGKEALKAYMAFPEAPHRVVSLISRYRKWFKVRSGFLEPYMMLMKKHGDGNIRLHTDYNQAVRTGRMSSSNPNTQQVPPAARTYILPDEGCTLLDFDLKQIEYRCIADLIEDDKLLRKYKEDAEADYHDVMAELCGIDRKPAKNMNFAVSFGAGKAKTIAMLKSAFDPNDVPNGYDFDTYCAKRGDEIYKTYHEKLPSLRITINQASEILKRRRFVRNRFGRRRHLESRFCYKAFNTVVQSWAADIMKRVTLNLCNLLENTPVKIVAIVHDSWVISCPTELVDEWIPRIKECIESTETRMRIPMYASYGKSDKNWRECK